MANMMIEARGLVRTFKTRGSVVEAVRGIDLDVQAGEIVGLLGPNGAGKTTTQRMLATLLLPTAGEAKVYTSKGDSGADIGRAFCADCGTPLWSIPGAGAPFFPVKLGALDDSSAFAPALHLYTDSAQPWHLMGEGLPRFPKMPPMAPPT